jgi:predicted MFS family arabinose efflux permease
VPRTLDRPLVLVLALACAVAVGNVYFPQALITPVASGFDVSTAAAAAIVTATQLGYAAGILLIVPLGDRLAARPLILTLLGLVSASLLAAGAAPTLGLLVAASALVGLTTVFAQVISTLAAGMVAADRRARVAGTLLSGSIGGILLARTFGGVLGQHLGWRAPYLVAAVGCAALATVLARALPATAPRSRQPYPALVVEPLRLLAAEPLLRRSALYQASTFAGFTAAWSGIAQLLSGPVYSFGADAVGFLALVGVATMVVTPLAGRAVDRRGPDHINTMALIGSVAATPLLAAASLGGTTGLAALVVATLQIDVAMQCGMVANVARFQAVRPEALNRMRSAYMTCAYMGGSGGSLLGTIAYTSAGWHAVAALVALAPTPALFLHLRRTAARPAPRPAPSAATCALTPSPSHPERPPRCEGAP